MHITSNISLLDRMVANYSALSNLLYSSELDRMGGVILHSRNTTAPIARTISYHLYLST